MNKKKICFNNFHQQTKAIFNPIPVPKEEPDFISHSGSCYWDVKHGVIRYSDHWVGQGDCQQQKTCKWSFSEPLVVKEWATGYCSYAEFFIRRSVMQYQRAEVIDFLMAERLSSGRILPLTEWRDKFGAYLPSWTKALSPQSTLLDVHTQNKLRAADFSETFVHASESAIREVLDNGRYPLSRALE